MNFWFSVLQQPLAFALEQILKAIDRFLKTVHTAAVEKFTSDSVQTEYVRTAVKQS